MSWTRFMDMHSGGGLKETPYEYIYIEAAEAEAQRVFYARFGHNPERVSCTCCGEDYSIDESPTLETATAYERNCAYAYFGPDGKEVPRDEAWKFGMGNVPGYSQGYVEESRLRWKGDTSEHIPLGEYLKLPTVLVIRADEITDAERKSDVPEQGYVWRD